MIRTLFIAGLSALLGTAFAEPYIAVRTGFKCAVCHVNHTGGGKRTEFGEVYSQTRLLMASAVPDLGAFSFNPKLNQTVSVGANFRTEQVYTTAYTSKAVNPTDSVQTAPASLTPFVWREKNLYLDFDLARDRLKLYFDVDMGTGSAREMWAMVNLPWNIYAKAGHMLLPYGYRLMDDEAFVRNNTGYTYGTTGDAYEMGFEPGPLSLIVNVTEQQLSSVGSLVFNNLPVIRTFRVGGSYSYELTKALKHTKGSQGAFAGVSFGMFTLLAERDYTKYQSVNKIENYVELGFLPVQGLNFRVVYEDYQPDRTISTAQNLQQRITVGAEPFITQYLQLGIYYRKNDWIPQNLSMNQDQIVSRIHVFF